MEDQNRVLCVSFDQNNASFAMGRDDGFKLISIETVDVLNTLYDSAKKCNYWWKLLTHRKHENTHIIDALFSSMIVASVSTDSPHKLLVTSITNHAEIFNCTYANPIVSTLVVCFEQKINIYSILPNACKGIYVIHSLRTPDNLIALSDNVQNSYLAYPAETAIGKVDIFDAVQLKFHVRISAHESTLAALAFNASGTRIATASEKGTIIRVFNVKDGSKVIECLRGTKRFVNIHSLNFSADSQLLAACSNTETVHIFKLVRSQGYFEYFGQKLEEYGYFDQLSKYFNLIRAFATIHLPSERGKQNTCSIALFKNIPHILVASKDDLFIYNINLIKGGECSLLYQHRLTSNVLNERITELVVEENCFV
uniref:Uncharacterized protein n=1 Tax=Strigamia maritima TaxID=126957 RepID=T1IJY9_STRMM